jgi:hypothetical protein
MFPVGVRDELKGFVQALEPGVYDSVDATRLVGLLAEIERLAAVGKVLLAKRVADSGALGVRGERSAAKWLAKVSGTSVGEASGSLAAVERLDRLPATDQALRQGRISPAQARHISDAAVDDPAVEAELVATAERGSLSELRDAARRARAAREDERERYARLRAGRFLRTRTEVDGVFTGTFRLTPDDGAELLAAIAPFRDAAFQQARAGGRHEPLEAYAADALVGLARWFRTGGGEQRDRGDDGQAPVRPARDTKIIVRVDADALRRGHAEGGEVCEIAGVGPVPVPVVYSMLPEALATAVITNGEAVATVAHAGRAVTATQRTALQWQGICCEVDGCDVREHLEIDHLVDFAITRHTKLDELGFKCRHHHDLKTYQGWDFIDGTTQLVPPGHPLHPGPMASRAGPARAPTEPLGHADQQLPLTAAAR